MPGVWAYRNCTGLLLASRAAATSCQAKYQKLFCLANNAGIMALPDVPTADGYDPQMQINYLSHFLLTPGRISRQPSRACPGTRERRECGSVSRQNEYIGQLFGEIQRALNQPWTFGGQELELRSLQPYGLQSSHSKGCLSRPNSGV